MLWISDSISLFAAIMKSICEIYTYKNARENVMVLMGLDKNKDKKRYK